MRKIKDMAINTMKLGYLEESEQILYRLMEAQTKELGLMHEETLDTIVVLGQNLAQSEKWEQLDKLYHLLSLLCNSELSNFDSLAQTLHSLESLRVKVS